MSKEHNLEVLTGWLNSQIKLHARLLENRSAPSQSRAQWEGAIIAYKETLAEVTSLASDEPTEAG